MHSVSTVQIPKNVTSFALLQPSVRIKPLNLQSASSFHVPSISINKCFYNGPKVVISPLKSSIQRLSSFNKRTLHKRHRLPPRILKCNAKRCMCCNNLSCNSTISSTVNGRVFSVKLPLDVTWNTAHIIYVLTWNAPNCGIQYVGQTGRALKTRFREHTYQCRTKKLRNFLYQHFRKSGHSFNDVSVQPVEHFSYDSTATNSFKAKSRFIAELDWIKKLQTPFPLGLNDNIYQTGNISKDPTINIFSICF